MSMPMGEPEILFPLTARYALIVMLLPLGAAVAGGGGEVHAFGQVGIGDAAFLLQHGQDAAVGCVEF
jgi:hypothetical protein